MEALTIDTRLDIALQIVIMEAIKAGSITTKESLDAYLKTHHCMTAVILCADILEEQLNPEVEQLTCVIVQEGEKQVYIFSDGSEVECF